MLPADCRSRCPAGLCVIANRVLRFWRGDDGGPWGASAGAALGEMAAGKAGQSVGEKAALSKWESKLTKLSDVAKP